jgi:hypothetical protein
MQQIACLRVSSVTRLLCFGFLCSGALVPRLSGADSTGPDTHTLLQARADSTNWILPARTYAGNRVARVQINKSNVVSQLRTVVTQTMPLTAPGSLKPDENAAVMAYLLSYNCVQAAGSGQQEFPTRDLPDLQKVELGSASCPPK